MRWIVGIDLADRSGGALQMAAWLRTHHDPAAEQDFIGVHVLDERWRGSLRSDLVPEWDAACEREVRARVTEPGVASALADVRVVDSPSPEAGLTRAVLALQCDGLLVGRVGRRDGRSLQRLGGVARRLLRHLPAPIMVVPPDLPRADIGRGPLILATDLTHDSANAAAIATRLAKELRRGLLVVHVEDVWQATPPLVFEGLSLIPPGPTKKAADVAAWARDHGLATAEPRLASGGVVESLLALATDEDAPILICGSRCLNLAERLFASSTAAELARLADRAVLVVPASGEGA